MKRGILRDCDACLYSNEGKPVKIVGISCGKRRSWECAREDPVSHAYLEMALAEAKKQGAEIQLIDLRDIKINPCKECYSTCPAQCRLNETTFQCDCYYLKTDHMFYKDKILPIEQAYDALTKQEFFDIYNDPGRFGEKDEMYVVYKAMIEADGVIFATSTDYYGRPPLLQAMLSRFCALDGGVEMLWGDGKNLRNSVKYSKNKKMKYKQRMYGRWAGFINCSKEGDSVTPDLMKACSMMGMKILPLGVAYRVNWYMDPTHRSDTKNSLKDPYTISLAKHLGRDMVKEIKSSKRIYGIYADTV